MRQDIEARLEELQREYEAGQRMIADLDSKRQSLAQTLLRIEGAMQVLRELMGSVDESAAGGESPPPAA